ncbi:DUF934 domain-containing protein [Ralstonia solanacearum]|uniref:DUF934 domain-containing protein n=1 Tax=Ralstonia solanacearum species complex TaxID=3116862 RepID=UPI000E674BAE|nr:DUF934 domain-containing protein [Ralstonia solanacearum]MBT1538084.1 DUF934 domain-containing protein [Ralstonia solanacearum]QOK82316.1 DUF934 domain-containing protein [Ralstonia solanacearum]
MIDTVHDPARCGFDRFAIGPGHDPEATLKALSTFSASYQRACAMPARRWPPAVFCASPNRVLSSSGPMAARCTLASV